MAIEVEIKKWGNSIGIILPKSLICEEGLRENDKIIINIVRKSDLSKTFGREKRSMSGQEFKDIVRQGWEKK
ncbi:MAG: AbrB/MazE/SpoVT family DNA-binding domain-containing protein [Nanoarchaeota archaeon]